MNYEFKTEQFSGPIEKLLELIEEKKMEITELNLADVTADFLKYLEKLESVESRLLADFIVVASKLLLIKSKAILPGLPLTEDEEKDIKDLEARISFYQQFKPAIAILKNMAEQKKFSFSRPLFFGRPAIFYPPKNLNNETLRRAIDSALEALKEISTRETKVIESSIISLEEKIKEVVSRLDGGTQYFGKIAKEKSRAEIIVFFLALLHLLREQMIKVEQEQVFDDIIIKKTEN